MTQRDDYLAWLLAHVGLRYCNEGPWRCTGERQCYDCSGFAGAGLVAVGARPAGYCTNTDGMAAEIKQAGTGVSSEVARATPGCWAIRLGSGPDGHIVVSLGIINGVARTVEAASHARGIITGYFDGRHFDVFGKPPGLAGFNGSAGPTIKPGVNVSWKIVHHPKASDAKPGYWCVDETGHVYSYGVADYHGGEGFKLPSGATVHLNGKCDGFDPTPTGAGYVMISSVGSVYAFGDAHQIGDPHGDAAT